MSGKVKVFAIGTIWSLTVAFSVLASQHDRLTTSGAWGLACLALAATFFVLNRRSA